MVPAIIVSCFFCKVADSKIKYGSASFIPAFNLSNDKNIRLEYFANALFKKPVTNTVDICDLPVQTNNLSTHSSFTNISFHLSPCPCRVIKY